MSSPLPSAFKDRLLRLLPADRFQDAWESFHRPRVTGFRINTLLGEIRQEVEQLRREGLVPVEAGFWESAFWVPPEQRSALTDARATRLGRVYVQSLASMLPPLVLECGVGEQVLDLAAAPGSKTLQLAALMEGGDGITAVESVRKRFFRLRRNLDHGGAAGVRTLLGDGGRLWRRWPERFDRVLLDAPCSGEGRFSSLDARSYAYWSEKKIREMVRKQRRLLAAAVHSLRPGGLLVYSTCTLAPEENEGVVAWALRRFRGLLVLEPVPICLEDGAILPGLTCWNDRELPPELACTVRVVPSRRMEAFFVARLRKTGSTTGE